MLDYEENWRIRTIKEAIYSEENEHHVNEYPSSYQIFGNHYYEKANQRKQLPKLQYDQAESRKVCQKVWFHTSPKPKSTDQKRP